MFDCCIYTMCETLQEGCANVFFFVCACVEITHVCMYKNSVILYQMTEKCLVYKIVFLNS